MKKMSIRNLLPAKIAVPLWGNRKKWGLVINESDPDWLEWQTNCLSFYNDNQRSGSGAKVNDAGYSVMKNIDVSGKTILEIGPGDIRHINFWRSGSVPSKYILADIDQDMLNKGEAKLKAAGISTSPLLMQRGQSLPLADSSIDIVVSFYALEHIYPLAGYLKEVDRLLKPDGLIVGGIPTEGGLAWGLGRYLTSRRWLKKNTQITPDKIICWEHPNYADQIIRDLDNQFERKSISYWPFNWLRLLDINLIIRFVYRKKKDQIDK
jgi:ubiquinone/menaquinone biosynthesis C-methylase UbiE